MSYKRSDSDSFGEYQLGEGFGAAVHGDINRTDNIAKMAQNGAQSLPAGLQGYTSYPSMLQGFPQFGDEFGGHAGDKLTTPGATGEALKITGLKGYETCEGYEGYEDFGNVVSANTGSFAGFEGIEDDAFAGYSFGNASDPMKATSMIAQRAIDDDDDSGLGGFDGYGTLAGGPEESFHTSFHRASMASSESGLIKELAAAVKTVSLNTPASTRKQYYDLAKEMITRRKTTDLRHLDMQRVEIESNIGWLSNPGLPKSGGFNAVLKKAMGTVGSRLAKGEKDDLKARQGMAVGKRIKADLARSQGLGGFGLGAFGEGSKLKYLGLGIAGIVVAGIICKLLKDKAAAPAMKKRKRRKKRK